jgi:hypothetical protein
MKGCRKRIADDTKDKPIVRFNGLIQDFVMPRKQKRHLVGILLGKFGTAFDIGKEKRDGARRETIH